MIFTRLLQSVLQWTAPFYNGADEHLDMSVQSAFAFSLQWHILGPFQIGTREATWGADPLEFSGGFRSLEYNEEASFKSSLASNGTVAWSNVTATLTTSARDRHEAALHIDFPAIDWQGLRDTYGWAALQWQAWARGEITVNAKERKTLAFNSPFVIEYWIDGEHHFGGDFYHYGRASNLLHLNPGVHKIDVRIVRDVRAMGGATDPTVDVELKLMAPVGHLDMDLGVHPSLLFSDLVGEYSDAVLASPYASITTRNNGDRDIHVFSIEANKDACLAELLAESPIRFIPGQTRPIAFKLACVTPYELAPIYGHIIVSLKYRVDGDDQIYELTTAISPRLKGMFEPHKVTFLHPSGIVSYAILRPPSALVNAAISNATAGTGKADFREEKLPVMLVLHGAGVEADSPPVREILDPVPDLHAWALYPSGVTPWCGDDWHTWGFADVEAAIAAIPSWIERLTWNGPGVEVKKWLVVGHSNGGQGAWYALTHRPDNIIAAAPLSGYSSIQNYVPYSFWHPADPGRTAVVQSALLGYRHELLLSNTQGVPILQQHGSADDNVPAYHSRLLSQLLREAGSESTYLELPGKPHYWDGVVTTEPLKDFYDRQLASWKVSKPPEQSIKLVSANPGDTDSKYGVKILQLATPSRMGEIIIDFEPRIRSCDIRLTNVRQFLMPFPLGDCLFMSIDGQLKLQSTHGNVTLTKEEKRWRVDSESIGTLPPGVPPRIGKQIGNMDSILRTLGSFVIVRHSSASSKIVLQISRNLCQYFGADTEIVEDFDSTISKSGNIISVAIGDDFPPGIFPGLPIQFRDGAILVRDGSYTVAYPHIKGLGLGAIFIRPLRLGRLELVVWGVNEESLGMAARLVPMMTGVGQPDFVVMDRTVMYKGMEGALAMGFFDSFWQVSKNSFVQY